MVEFLHNFNLHKNEVFLCLLVEVNILDGHLLPCVLVRGQRDHPGSSRANFLVLRAKFKLNAAFCKM